MVAGVAKLGAGEMLVADRQMPPRRQRWHTLAPDSRRALAVRGLPPERHAGSLRTLLECAVADRLPGEQPLPGIDVSEDAFDTSLFNGPTPVIIIGGNEGHE
jgi:hypothetical protein